MKRDIFCANSHFFGTLPRVRRAHAVRMAGRAPRIVDIEDGGQKWVFEGRSVALRGSCGTVLVLVKDADRSAVSATSKCARASTTARLSDMDSDGVAVSACYSSPTLIGFGGDLFFHAKDADLGVASMMAYTDWVCEEWWGAAPDRFVPIRVI